MNVLTHVPLHTLLAMVKDVEYEMLDAKDTFTLLSLIGQKKALDAEIQARMPASEV